MEPRLLRGSCEGALRLFYNGTEVALRLLLVLFFGDSLFGGVSTFCLPSVSHRVSVCYHLFCLVFAGRAGALVSIISVMMLTFHVCVCGFLCLCHHRCSFACLTVVVLTCLCLDAHPFCMAPKIGECFAPPSSDGSQKCFKFWVRC